MNCAIRALGHPAVHAHYLTIDPPAMITGEEGDELSYVVRDAEPSEWVRGRNLVDKFLALAFEEQRRAGRARRNRIDGHVLALHLASEDKRHGFDRPLTGGVGAVGTCRETHDRGREVDERSTRTDLSCRQLAGDERAPQIDTLDPIKSLEVHLRDGAEWHDPGRVDHDVDAAETLRGVLEHGRHFIRLADVRPQRDSRPSTGLDARD